MERPTHNVDADARAMMFDPDSFAVLRTSWGHTWLPPQPPISLIEEALRRHQQEREEALQWMKSQHHAMS